MKLSLFLIGHHKYGWQLNHPIIIIKNKLNAMELSTTDLVNEKKLIGKYFSADSFESLKAMK